MATAILLLATARTWRVRRSFVEFVTAAILLLSALAALRPLPTVVTAALLPFAALASAWSAMAYAEWRFAPDFGQQGCLWILPGAARSTLPCGLGLVWGLILVSLLPVARGDLAVRVVLLVTAMGATVVVHRWRRPPHQTAGSLNFSCNLSA